MTKREFCKSIIETIDNMNHIGVGEDEQVQALMNLIAPLKPKSLKKFAKWGVPEQQSTEEKCWD